MNDQPAERASASPRRSLPTIRIASAEIVRFGDLDPQGHANQAVFLTYFESGRVAMFRNPDLSIGVPGITYVMVRMEVDYMKELHWPGTSRSAPASPNSAAPRSRPRRRFSATASAPPRAARRWSAWI